MKIVNNQRLIHVIFGSLDMSKTVQHFLFGFSSFINIFGSGDSLKLSKGGFSEDHQKLKQDVRKISSDFTKVTYDKQKTGNSHQK